MSMWWKYCRKLVKRIFKLAFMVPKKAQSEIKAKVDVMGETQTKQFSKVDVLEFQGRKSESGRS